MAYTINKTDGSELVSSLADGTTNTSATSITLIGKNTTGYGESINENFVKILENFSRSAAPSSGIEGQLWWDSGNKRLMVQQGTGWKPVSHAISGTSAPTVVPIAGDLWWDSSLSQLRGYSGSSWIVVGPQVPPGTATTDFQGNAVSDTSSASHTVGNLIVNNKLTAIISSDNTSFVPAITYPASGITRINPGINFSSTAEPTAISTPNMIFGVSSGNVQVTSLTTGYGFNITANVSGTPRTVFFISGATGDAAFTGNVSFPAGYPVSIASISGNLIPNSNGTQNLGSTSAYWNNLYVRNVNLLGNVSVDGTLGVTGATTLTSLGVTGSATFTSIASNIVPSGNLTYNLGSASAWWNNIYGTAVHAQYADLAERFEADTEYGPGTVVELGGPAEITAAVEDLSENVFGVISTRAAYLMNSSAGTNQTHPPIAVQGRVPVKVTGRIRKGDRLVSAGNGIARAGSRSEITAWNVIGRALENKLDDGEGIIEAVVKLNS